MNTRPNILVVMSDDHGPWAVNAAGCPAARTPSMDWLAETGCRFTHAFAPSPVCSPARACFFTGQIPSAHGIHDWIEERNSWDTDWLAGRTTLAQHLQTAGYETALVGKWHCGRSHVPQAGFDHWFSYARGHQFPHFGAQSFATRAGVVSGHGRQSRFLFDHARSWLRARDRAQPFFLFYGPVDTHSPFSGHSRSLVSAMRRADLSKIRHEPGRYPPERRVLALPENEAERREHLAQYLAAVAFIDEQLGGLVDTLDELGALENTFILYTSDHGHMDGHHGLVGKGNGSVPQNFHEEAIHVPSLARWPVLVPAASIVEAPIDHCDWFSTLLDFAGVAVPPVGPGRSLIPLWQSPDAAWRTEQVCEYGNARMIRTAQGKLIVRNHAGTVRYTDEFYDLEEDPRETENRLDSPRYREGVADLRSRLAAYFQRWETPGKSGWEVDRLPHFNPEEAWRVEAGAPSKRPGLG
ncbi:MAG: hypothetical protein EXS37_02520 [Opitutus sp.]|nr:hypothetical protein [Opitutus sp.]